MDASIASVADRLLADLKTRLGDAWTHWSVDQQQLALDVCLDAAGLSVQAMAAQTDAARAALAAEKRHVDAQLENLGAATAVQLAPIFWSIVQTALGAAVQIAIAAA